MAFVDVTKKLLAIDQEMTKIRDGLVLSPVSSFEEYQKLAFRYQGLKQAREILAQQDADEDDA